MNSQNQFGLFAKDAQGNPMEIGTAPGQANLFDRERFKIRIAPASPAPVSDIPGQELFFTKPKLTESGKSMMKLLRQKCPDGNLSGLI